MVKEGKFDHIGLSEVSAASIHRAAKIHPIATVEVEYSLWATEPKTNGVLETSKELGIVVVAYSPLGRGMLAGKFKTHEDIPPPIRARWPRFSEENFEHNIKFLHKLEEIAKRKGVTTAQLALKWVLTVDDNMIPIPGATTLGRVQENMGAVDVEFTKDELDELNNFVETTKAKGGRYDAHQEQYLFA
jgi:pyridoxine 4-dehydrogenase